jgi:hypothetical protein
MADVRNMCIMYIIHVVVLKDLFAIIERWGPEFGVYPTLMCPPGV